MKRILFVLVVCSVLISCACSTNPIQKNTSTIVIRGVPFFPQEDYQCGPASLSGVLHFWGADIGVGEIAGEIFSKSARGTLTIDMILYAERKGYVATQYKGGLDDLKSKIRAGYPLIVLVDYGYFVYHQEHYMVVVGFDEDGVIVNSGKSEGLYITNEDFLRIWKRTNRWTLWIRPK